MNRTNLSKLPRYERGIALALALIALVGVTIICLASLRLGLMELVMAGNAEARMNAFQQAQNGLDATAAVDGNFSIAGNVGYTNCTPGHSGSGSTCDAQTIALPAGYSMTHSEIEITRLDDGGAPPRWAETSPEGGKFYGFVARSNYDGSTERGGRSTQVQGYVVPLPDLGPEDRL